MADIRSRARAAAREVLKSEGKVIEEEEDDGCEDGADDEEVPESPSDASDAKEVPDIINCAFFGILDSITLVETGGEAGVREAKYVGNGVRKVLLPQRGGGGQVLLHVGPPFFPLQHAPEDYVVQSQL